MVPGESCQPAAQGQPGKPALEVSHGPGVLSPSRWRRSRLWDARGYLAEQPGSRTERRADGLAIWLRPLSLACFIQMCRHPIAISHSEEGLITHLWD